MIIAIVVTFNGVKWIDKCFGSLVNSSIPLKILAIDNSSSDGTAGNIRRKFPDVEVIEIGENLGFGKANNIGLNRAINNNADYVFLLNQDAWVQPNTIEQLIRAHKKHPEYSIVSPMHLNAEGDALDYSFSNYISPKNCNGLYSDIFVKKNIDQIYNVRFVNAACWLMTNECITKIGGFNPSFFHYGEDSNYIQRLKYFGLNIGIYPKCCIFHDRKNRTIDLNFQNEKELYKRQLILNLSDPKSKARFFGEI
jgi:GT2 family glycosyltransferase